MEHFFLQDQNASDVGKLVCSAVAASEPSSRSASTDFSHQTVYQRLAAELKRTLHAFRYQPVRASVSRYEIRDILGRRQLDCLSAIRTSRAPLLPPPLRDVLRRFTRHRRRPARSRLRIQRCLLVKATVPRSVRCGERRGRSGDSRYARPPVPRRNVWSAVEGGAERQDDRLVLVAEEAAQAGRGGCRHSGAVADANADVPSGNRRGSCQGIREADETWILPLCFSPGAPLCVFEP